MYSPESNRTERTPLKSKVEQNPYGYCMYFASEAEAREAIGAFWIMVAPEQDLENIARSLQEGRDLRDIMITDAGMRTESVPLRKELTDGGYTNGVFFSGNGAPLKKEGTEALQALGYLSL